jgi:hypothetical protein
MQLIRAIEEARGSTLIAYIVADRQNAESRIDNDVFPVFHRHLSDIGDQHKIDLLLYSTGGEAIAGYGIVRLLREFCTAFNVVIPFKAHSTATLMALGADEIVMTRMGQLSPIDPSIYSPLGPWVRMPGDELETLVPVNVEDVNGFIQLAKDGLGLDGDTSMRAVLQALVDELNPVVLGAIHRSREQVAFLASALLSCHAHGDKQATGCVDTLTRKRFSHQYIISRTEAKKDLQLNIVEPDNQLTDLIMRLFSAYQTITKMDKPYNPEVELAYEDSVVVDLNKAIVESRELTHVFRTTKRITRFESTRDGESIPLAHLRERTLQDQWVEDGSL